MKISLVTISYNQQDYLREALDSVLNQEGVDLEYIVVDPGSTDGSREIIEEYSDRISKIVLEPDQGPADGLNHGFSHATGDIYGYLNSDDILLPGSLSKINDYFENHDTCDVVSGHCFVIDGDGEIRRESYSDTFRPYRVLYGAANLMQPSSFFRSSAFKQTNGFQVENHNNWDTELWLEMYENGCRFEKINEFLSGYRVYSNSISGQRQTRINPHRMTIEVFQRRLHRKWNQRDTLMRSWFLMLKYFSEPRWIRERLLRGSFTGA